MKRIAVNTQNASYDVVVGGGLSDLRSLYQIGSGVVIVEESLCSNSGLLDLNLPIETVNGGESVKCLAQIEKFYQIFLDRGLDKSSVIIAVGGGAITDAVSFAAATFHRGMPCITVPTTLLSQVDASIGGKNGVNFGGVKNIVGTIVQPKLVLCDLSFLNTLSRSEFSFGISEIIKAGVILDPELIQILRQSSKQIFQLERVVLEEIISRAVQVKADIVGRDEFESHERMKLNFGHTIGHALETSCKLSHGQAVACGMVLETKLSVLLGLCSEDLVSDISDLCKMFELPTTVDFDIDDIVVRMLQDKKKRSERLQFALPTKLGQVEIIAVKIDEVKKYLSDLRIS